MTGSSRAVFVWRVLIWTVVAAIMAAPLVVAATSPLLAWRQPVYIAAGLAGVVALAIVFLQPLAVAGLLPGLASPRGRLLHGRLGAGLVAAVIVHVAGLWITSPPDVIDALLFASPTPFSAWGVIAMWAVFAAGLLALFRRRLGLAPRLWRRLHASLAAVILTGGIIHALLIEGTMGTLSKIMLCAAALAAFVAAVTKLNTLSLPRKRHR